MDSSAYIAGLGLGASLIIAIGAQNALVLRQGIKREHVFAVSGTCTLIDWTLIALGAGGFGSLIARFPALTAVAAWAGAAFLIVYGALAFRSAVRPGTLSAEEDAAPEGDGRSRTAHESVSRPALAPVLGATLAVSLLNPHVYLDTVVLLGSVGAQYAHAARASFVLGAGMASALWFFGLGYGARLLAPLFARPVAWRVLDVLIGIVMWSIAIGLVRGQLG